LILPSAVVTYAQCAEADNNSLVVVEVVACVIEPASRTEKRTNTFYFTFSINQPTIPTLQPLLYDDAIKVRIRHFLFRRGSKLTLFMFPSIWTESADPMNNTRLN
jgi:hypothetical protein